MNGAVEVDRELFGSASFLRLLSRSRSPPYTQLRAAHRAQLAFVVCWVPLALLTLIEGTFMRSRDASSFIFDVAAQARYVLALPLCAFASSLLAPRLSEVVSCFRDLGFVQSEDIREYTASIAAARRASTSLFAAAFFILLAYSIIGALIYSDPSKLARVPQWHFSVRSGGKLSLAGWWHALVSLPVLLVALLHMFWRWGVWIRLLWRISKLSLALVPVHPDGAAGLRFVSYSLRAYVPYAFVLGILVAAPIANDVLYANAALSSYAGWFFVFLLFVTLFFTAPLLVFSRQLLRAWRDGVFEYGALADRVGREFEREWLRRGEEIDRSALTRQDFSAVTDLYSVVANVYRMHLVLFDLPSLLVLIAAASIPFVPVILMAMPFQSLIMRLAGMLF